ncbi:YHYH protein [Mycobacterium sp. 236(2023)]|uniref:YHYH protein n=1 Tax=Mycobacterium sp. 236(2023) TaxID=3038163 RepID=UPI0024150873|nr:YHYH protein [Mycobacterium sp. 236(2023)]MDG4668823.1 YHYH protein [Mycobacterium sp. 236(2023)]
MLKRIKCAGAALVAGMVVATVAASPVVAKVPDTLGNSAPNLSIFKAQKGGIYLGGPLFSIVIPSNTTLQTSTAAWVNKANNTIVIPKLPTVTGTVTAKDIDPRGSVFAMTQDKTHRYFKGNGLPSTPMGRFGSVQPGTAAYPNYTAAPGGTNTTPGTPGFGQQYPNAAAIGISAYNLDIKVPLAPKYLTTPQPIQYLITGVTLTGTVWHAEIANANATAWYNPISILPLDQCYGHPYSQQYHLHAYSWKCLPNGTTGPSPLLGYALDGFGIYGPRGADGKEITNAQLDECHGMTSPVMWNGKIQNIYHYVLNSEYPYSVGCFRGVVDPANVAKMVLPRLGQPAHAGHS